MNPEKYAEATLLTMSNYLNFVERVPLEDYHKIAYFKQEFIGKPSLKKIKEATKTGLQKFVSAARSGSVKLVVPGKNMQIAQAQRFIKNKGSKVCVAHNNGLIVVAESQFNSELNEEVTTVFGIYSVVQS